MKGLERGDVVHLSGRPIWSNKALAVATLVLVAVVGGALAGTTGIPAVGPWRIWSTAAILSDAPFSVSLAVLEKAITCPNGLQRKPGGVVLLVHGTGSKGAESWERGPYGIVLPTAGKGYDVCWIDLPGRSLGDAQLSAEYVAYAIKHLAPQSATGQVGIIGHSQGGGLNPQWALTFWPSTQRLVSNYIALAGDFHGTEEGFLFCNPLKLGTCNPSVWQQTTGSHYLAAQNSLALGGGGRALVPTTSIYTITDDVLQPEVPPLRATSYLRGAGVHALQDLDICGPAHAVDHVSILVDSAAFGLAKLALEHGGPADVVKFDRTYCAFIPDYFPAFSFSVDNVSAVRALEDRLAVGPPRTAKEPPLQPYVCSRGFASGCGAAFPRT